MRKKSLVFVLYNIMVIGIVLSSIELYFDHLLNHPDEIPHSFKKAFEDYYSYYDRKIIQYNRNTARYDEDLFYTLKSGSFEFNNREFNTQYNVNSLGLRDDELSLNDPKIVVVGDSYAMGWGVKQEETFSELLQSSLQETVLNAGISSYGTVREMESLNRIDLSQVEYLIIQYCMNDESENKAYYEFNNQLNISSKHTYDQTVKLYEENVNYYPLKYSSKLLSALILGNDIMNPIDHPTDSSDLIQTMNSTSLNDAQLFLNVLMNSSHIDSIPNIIVTHLDYFPPSQFFDHLRGQLQLKKYKRLADRLILLDMTEYLNMHDFFALDHHLNAKGHEKVFMALHNLIENQEVTFHQRSQTIAKTTFDGSKTKWKYNAADVYEESYVFDEKKEWGPSLHFELTSELLDSGYYFLEIEYAINSKKMHNGQFVFDFSVNNERLHWESRKSFEQGEFNERLTHLKHQISLYSLKPLLDEHSSIDVNIYYWNSDKKEMAIDDMMVQLKSGNVNVIDYRKPIAN